MWKTPKWRDRFQFSGIGPDSRQIAYGCGSHVAYATPRSRPCAVDMGPEKGGPCLNIFSSGSLWRLDAYQGKPRGSPDADEAGVRRAAGFGTAPSDFPPPPAGGGGAWSSLSYWFTGLTFDPANMNPGTSLTVHTVARRSTGARAMVIMSHWPARRKPPSSSSSSSPPSFSAASEKPAVLPRSSYR